MLQEVVSESTSWDYFRFRDEVGRLHKPRPYLRFRQTKDQTSPDSNLVCVLACPGRCTLIRHVPVSREVWSHVDVLISTGSDLPYSTESRRCACLQRSDLLTENSVGDFPVRSSTRRLTVVWRVPRRPRSCGVLPVPGRGTS